VVGAFAFTAVAGCGESTRPGCNSRGDQVSRTFVDWSKTQGRELLPGLVSWSSTGEELQLVKTELAPGCDFPPHSHPHEQFIAVLSGTFECDVDGATIRSGPGGVFHFASNQPHGGRVIGDEPVVMIEAFHPTRADYAPETMQADHDSPR
jgi:quercetin dioxygenase-like cupin family protein